MATEADKMRDERRAEIGACGFGSSGRWPRGFPRPPIGPDDFRSVKLYVGRYERDKRALVEGDPEFARLVRDILGFRLAPLGDFAVPLSMRLPANPRFFDCKFIDRWDRDLRRKVTEHIFRPTKQALELVDPFPRGMLRDRRFAEHNFWERKLADVASIICRNYFAIEAEFEPKRGEPTPFDVMTTPPCSVEYPENPAGGEKKWAINRITLHEIALHPRKNRKRIIRRYNRAIRGMKIPIIFWAKRDDLDYIEHVIQEEIGGEVWRETFETLSFTAALGFPQFVARTSPLEQLEGFDGVFEELGLRELHKPGTPVRQPKPSKISGEEVERIMRAAGARPARTYGRERYSQIVLHTKSAKSAKSA